MAYNPTIWITSICVILTQSQITPPCDFLDIPVATGGDEALMFGRPYLKFIHLLNDPDTVLWEIQEYDPAGGGFTYCKHFHVPSSTLTPAVPCADPNIRPWTDEIGTIDPANTFIPNIDVLTDRGYTLQFNYIRNGSSGSASIGLQNNYDGGVPFWDYFTFPNIYHTTFILLRNVAGILEMVSITWIDPMSPIIAYTNTVTLTSETSDISWDDWDFGAGTNTIIVYEDLTTIRLPAFVDRTSTICGDGFLNVKLELFTVNTIPEQVVGLEMTPYFRHNARVDDIGGYLYWWDEDYVNWCTEVIDLVSCINIVPAICPNLLYVTYPPTMSPTTTESPTEAPSKTPSDPPTDSPSIDPTKTPSESPTKNPTAIPTISPAEIPTLSPSEIPSVSPFIDPTVTPSDSPSNNPSLSPSDNPTVTLSENPSSTPSNTPTISPSVNLGLSRAPSENPSLSPSRTPSINPIDSPSDQPTMSPSTNPSATPSIATDSPTMYPSMEPTEITYGPTNDPTMEPIDDSIDPGDSVEPTVEPTGSPTANPSEDANTSAGYTFTPEISAIFALVFGIMLTFVIL